VVVVVVMVVVVVAAPAAAVVIPVSSSALRRHSTLSVNYMCLFPAIYVTLTNSIVQTPSLQASRSSSDSQKIPPTFMGP
jgi:hypothetical protein